MIFRLGVMRDLLSDLENSVLDTDEDGSCVYGCPVCKSADVGDDVEDYERRARRGHALGCLLYEAVHGDLHPPVEETYCPKCRMNFFRVIADEKPKPPGVGLVVQCHNCKTIYEYLALEGKRVKARNSE